MRSRRILASLVLLSVAASFVAFKSAANRGPAPGTDGPAVGAPNAPGQVIVKLKARDSFTAAADTKSRSNRISEAMDGIARFLGARDFDPIMPPEWAAGIGDAV